MKVCKYCGSEVADLKSVCESCGAREFVYKCENCGNLFDSEYCPACGVRVGQRAKKCPKCGKEYFSNACPDCGYIPQDRQPVTNAYQYGIPAPKKRRTWLWILGWLFIFPVPLTIIITRKENISTPLKITLVVISWIAFFMFAFMGRSDDSTVEQAQGGPVTVSRQTVEETETTTQVIETTIEETETTIAFE